MTEKEALKLMESLQISHDCEMVKILDFKGTVIKALEDLQQYRAIETELKEKYHANVDIKGLVQCFVETIFKGENHEGFCILTNEDAKMWEEYRAIGTVEGYKRAVEVSKENFYLCNEYKARLKEYEAIGIIEEFKALKENERKCEDCAGCTNWKCDCANIRAKAIDEAIEASAKAICVGCGYLEGYKCNYKGANCGVSKPMLESVVKALEQMKEGAE